MSKILDKMMGLMKLDDYEEQGEEEEYEDQFNSFTGDPQPVKTNDQRSNLRSLNGGRANSKVMNFQANVNMDVVVIQPTSYDDAQDICDHIKESKPCIINLENMDHAVAQRIMDFVSGSCYTLDGNMQRISNNIFLIAPHNVDIVGDFQEELKSSGIINWDK